MKTATRQPKSISQIMDDCRKIQNAWSPSERLERRLEGENRRSELMEVLGLLELETQVA